MKYAFFMADATKLGALKLQGNIIFNNIANVRYGQAAMT